MGTLSDGSPLPDYLYAVCPWILAGSGSEPWYGSTIKTKTIEAIESIPEFVRGQGPVQPDVPVPPPIEPPQEMEMEYVGFDLDGGQEMIDRLIVSPAPNPNEPYWKITKIEIQHLTENQSVFAILPWCTDFKLQMFWVDGESGWAEPKSDALAPEGARVWAASQPIFRGGWGSYGIKLNVNAEGLWGIGLYEYHDGKLQMGMTAHHPTLVYFTLVAPPEAPEPPEPPEPIPDIPYTLKGRLQQAPYGFEDLREDIKAISNMQTVVAESLSAKRIDNAGNPLFGNLRQIVLHHLGGTYYGAMNLAKAGIQEGNATAEYHFIVERSGKIVFLVPVKYLTHHAYGANENGIGIVFEDEANEKQLEAGRFLIAALYEFLGAEGWGSFRLTGLLPHSMVWNGEDWHTACPGNVWPMILWSGEWPKF